MPETGCIPPRSIPGFPVLPGIERFDHRVAGQLIRSPPVVRPSRKSVLTQLVVLRPEVLRHSLHTIHEVCGVGLVAASQVSTTDPAV